MYTNDNIEVDENFSNEILAKVPCYDLSISSKRELIELECDIEDLDKIDTQLFLGKYELEGQIYEFMDTVKFIKNFLKKNN